MLIILIVGLTLIVPIKGKAIFNDKTLEQVEDQTDDIVNEDNPLITAILEDKELKDDDKNMELVRVPRQPSSHESLQQNLWRIDPPHPRTLAAKVHLIRGLLGSDLRGLLPLLGGHRPAPPAPLHPSPYIAGYTLTPILAPQQTPIIPPNALPHLAPPPLSHHSNCPHQSNPSSLLANIPPQLIQLFLSSLQNAPPGARAIENSQEQITGVVQPFYASLNYPSDALAMSDLDYPINLYMDPNQFIMRSGQDNLLDPSKASVNPVVQPPVTSLDNYGKYKRDSELNTLINTL